MMLVIFCQSDVTIPSVLSFPSLPINAAVWRSLGISQTLVYCLQVKLFATTSGYGVATLCYHHNNHITRSSIGSLFIKTSLRNSLTTSIFFRRKINDIFHDVVVALSENTQDEAKYRLNGEARNQYSTNSH